MHTLITGMTLSGKSRLAKEIGSELRLARHEVIAYNPVGEDGYTRKNKLGQAAAEWESYDPDEFHDEVVARIQKRRASSSIKERNRPLFLLIDEAHEMLSRGSSEYKWLGTRGRHAGLSCFFMTQHAAELNATVRGQCGTLYIFSSSLLNAKTLADDFGEPEIANASQLPAGTYFKKRRGVPGIDTGRIF